MSSIVQMERSLLLDEWDDYRWFLKSLTSGISNSPIAWDEIEKQAKEIEDPIQQDNYYEAQIQERENYQHSVSVRMNSFFAVSFALFEFQLLQICRIEQKFARNPIGVDKLGGRSGTERAKNYLNALGINFPADTIEWAEIATYRKIRNKIMHAGGLVPDNLTGYAEKEGIAPSGKFELTPEFCEKSLCTFKEFIFNLNTACEAVVHPSR